MKNRYKVLRLAEENGVATTKELRARVGDRVVELTVDRPLDEIVEELRALGAI